MQFSPEMITMDQWQKAVLPELRKLSLGQAPAVLSKVTLLAYFFLG